MKYKKLEMQSFNPIAYASKLLLFIVALLMAPSVMALTVNVTGADGVPITDYRWLIEEDKTYHVPLNMDGTVEMNGTTPAIDPNWRVGDPNRNTVSVSFHHSYMPVVAKGTEADAFPLACETEVPGDPCLDPSKNYFISVLPAAGYTLGGTPIKAGQEAVTVFVNSNPTPTAQITIFVHADNAPINNVWDLGELGLEGFSIILEDAGGKYGASAGIQSQDAFGNPLCTNYDPATGDVVPGGGSCVTGPDGRLTIKNLTPGKYGIMAVPPNAVETPADSGNFVSSIWTQTSTIEGKKLIDAWVKADEPSFFAEFGPPGPHVSIGFINAGPNDPYIDGMALTGGATVSGQIVNLHLSRAPDTAFYNGGPIPASTPWVGLNLGAAGEGVGVYAARANDDGSFSIPNVPAGVYQLVVWDDNLDLLFSKHTVVVNAGETTCNSLTSCNFGEIPVFQWFARMENHIYNDENENGVRDDGEAGIIEQAVNLRFRDGTIYQSFPTDGDGFVPFDEVFPFFSWLVAEVDFARFKATGLTVTVDDGGAILGGPAEGAGTNWNQVLNPQSQLIPLDLETNVNSNEFFRTELGPVLTQGFQTFLGQTSVLEWGKKAYGLDENGGISGVVMYAITRAEDDPEQAAAEPWEPGIPNVTVNLYDSTGATLLATTQTDSWDDSLPTNCQYGANAGSALDAPYAFRGVDTDCYDGLRNSNQVRPGVFDGGYAFGPQIDCADNGDSTYTCPSWVTQSATDASIGYIKPGEYLVEVDVPNGYEVIKSQDRNVDFGDNYIPSTELLAAPCANYADVDGDGNPGYTVPDFLALFPGEPAPLAGQQLPLCDQKLVSLSSGANAAADFSLFTEVPIAGHFIGFILDDTANEFDPASPQFGEKYAPPFLPVSIRDWTGREISRTVSDEYGVYNALIPSTYTVSVASPSGVAPNMLTTCMNAKSMPDGSDDPLHNPQYSQFCYTFQYMPGSTTYLDTPVVPVAAFAGADQNPLDCAFVDATPRIHSVNVTANDSVTNGAIGGPYIPTRPLRGTSTNNDNNRRARGPQTITITSMGTRLVPNPAYSGVGSTEPKAIERDYGFGDTTGTVTLGNQMLTTSSWNTNEITVLLPDNAPLPGAAGGRQLTVTRADNGASTITGVSVQVGLRPGSNVTAVTPGTGVIQTAINNAGTNDLILVAPGIYDELVIMWKPVQLQGWGEGSTTIDAIKAPSNKLAEWRSLAESLVEFITLAPGQELGFGAIGGIEPTAFFTEEGAGVFVLATENGNNRFLRGRNRGARIDGFTITGADTGGGVVVNAYADYLDISNNRVVNNSAFFAGGVRVGHPILTQQQGNNIVYSDADNDNVRIHHNTITQNGGLGGAGGGLALHTGSDDYQVTDNFVCGNFTNANGAGIAHYGLSDNGLIQGNTVLFNENFNQGTTVNGGGILVAGLPAFGCPIDPDTGFPVPACLVDPEQVLSPGSGSVEISANLIQGNSAGAGDGAGIRLSRINGQDSIANNGSYNGPDWTIDIINNMIVDNVAALSGGGISLQDALAVNILHNTIANNDNTSTSGEAVFTYSGTGDVSSAPQPGAGIVSRAHSATLAQFAGSGFSDASLVDNIIWHNRMFSWMSDNNAIPAISGLVPDIGAGEAPVYNDLAVIPAVGALSCTDCILTGDADPAFVAEYVNGSRDTTTIILEGTTSMQAPPAFDEGGNFIRLRYGPLTQTITDEGVNFGDLWGDYHIQATGSSALDAGSDAGITSDFDGELRPAGTGFDIGADEVQ